MQNLEIDDIDYLINVKELDLQVKDKKIYYDVEYLAKIEQNRIVGSTKYFCPDCKGYHYNASYKKYYRLMDLLKTLK